MTYEFNPGDVQKDHPNPFKVENLFLFISAVFYAVAGVSVLGHARHYIVAKENLHALAAGLLGIALLGFAIAHTGKALSQLRLLLGRKFPRGLAGELSNGQTGNGWGAEGIAEQMRHRALNFAEYDGAFAGVLYSLVRPLATSPAPIQAAAFVHFQSLITMLATLCSLVVSYFLFVGTPHEGVVSWIYLPLTGLSLAAPFVHSDRKLFQIESRGVGTRIGLYVLLAVVGPALIPRYVPAYSIPPMWMAPVLLLVGSIGCFALFFLSVVAQPDSATETSVSCEQTTIEMNCPPAQLWTELGRDFQANWTNGIPNRSYVNMPPEVADFSHGLFNGQILEETQPVPTGARSLTSLKDAMAAPHGRWMLALLLWGILLGAVAAWLAPQYAAEFGDMSRMEMSRAVLTVVALGTSTALAFRIAHLLWSRMYFKSRLIWVEVTGTHQMSELDVGNQVTGNIRSRSTLTRIEDATLRVWVTDIVSVAFGKEGDRSIIALAPADGVARSLADRLKEFALSQSMMVAPTSLKDLAKVAQFNAFGRAVDTRGDAGASILQLGTAAAEERRGGAVPPMLRGRVKWFDQDKGYGFIRGYDGVERFFGASQLTGGVKSVVKGQKVQYAPVRNTKGEAAQEVSIVP